MDDKRTTILLAIKERLEGLGTLRVVKIGTVEPRHEDRPCAAIIPESDQKTVSAKVAPGARPFKTRDLDVLIRVVADEAAENAGIELDAMLLSISQLFDLDANKRLAVAGVNLLTADVEEGATRWLYLDERWPQAGADIEFKFHYQV